MSFKKILTAMKIIDISLSITRETATYPGDPCIEIVQAKPYPSLVSLITIGSHAGTHVDAPRHLYLIPLDLLIRYLKPLGLEPVMVTFDNKGSRSWNRFGWQRYMMNFFSDKWMQKIAFVAGCLLSIPMSLWDTRGFNSSSYTVIFQKKEVV